MLPYLPEFFGLRIPLYGLMTMLGYLAAMLYCLKQRHKIGISKDELFDIIFYIILGAIIGGKLFFIFFNWDSFAASTLVEKIRYGFVFFGGFIGAVTAGIIVARVKKLPFFKFADFFAPAIALGHAIGRIGCFLAGCCYGKVSHSFLSVKFHNPECLVPHHLHDVGLYPTQLMESLGNFILFFILLTVFNKKHKEGTVIASYIIGYGLIRFIVEFFRGDDRGSYILGLSPSQFIAAALIILISAFLIKRNYGSK